MGKNGYIARALRALLEQIATRLKLFDVELSKADKHAVSVAERTGRTARFQILLSDWVIVSTLAHNLLNHPHADDGQHALMWEVKAIF
jgi:hypothetical protein